MNANWSGTSSCSVSATKEMMRINGCGRHQPGEQMRARLDPGPPLPEMTDPPGTVVAVRVDIVGGRW